MDFVPFTYLLFLRNGYLSYPFIPVNFTSTGQTTKAKAESYVNELIKNFGAPKMRNEIFEDYAGRFFRWDSCPHALRLREEGRPLTKRYMAIQRINLEKHVLKSGLQKMRLQDIKRSHILDFRSSIVAGGRFWGRLGRISGPACAIKRGRKKEQENRSSDRLVVR